MKCKLLTSLFFVFLLKLITAQGIEIHLKDSGSIITNTHGVFIDSITEYLIDFKKLNQEILATKNKDALLIMAMLDMQSNKIYKFNELIKLSKSYVFMNEILIKHLYFQLENKYGKIKFAKLRTLNPD
tara:strand:+ start:692 stop:1075 length:384 start_codon:yes stop_codon:yes gene_type:complete